MESPITVDNWYACKLIKAVGDKIKSYNLIYGKQQWTIHMGHLWHKFYNLVQPEPQNNDTEEEWAHLLLPVSIFYTHSYVQGK